MGSCQQCVHFREGGPVSMRSTAIKNMISDPRSEVRSAINTLVQRDETILASEEQQFASWRLMPVKQRPVRLAKPPVTTSYCAFEPQGCWHEVKNENGKCPDWKLAPPRTSCANCTKNQLAGGDANNTGVLTALQKAIAQSTIDTTALQQQYRARDSSIGPAKAGEIQDCYRLDGKLPNVPKYLNSCRDLSSTGTYVIGEIHNRFGNCGQHSAGTPSRQAAPFAKTATPGPWAAVTSAPPPPVITAMRPGTPSAAFKQLQKEVTEHVSEALLDVGYKVVENTIKPAITSAFHALFSATQQVVTGSAQAPHPQPTQQSPRHQASPVPPPSGAAATNPAAPHSPPLHPLSKSSQPWQGGSPQRPATAANAVSPPAADVLVEGARPLTMTMVLRAVEALEWLMEGKLTIKESSDYRRLITGIWKTGASASLQYHIDLMALHVKWSAMPPASRLQEARALRAKWLQSLLGSPGDPFGSYFCRIAAWRGHR